jgi:hypothetical protein
MHTDLAPGSRNDYTISSFVKEYQRLLKLENSTNPTLEAARFVITGYNKPAGHHARLETLSHAMSPDCQTPRSKRDIDSLLGFTENIPLDKDLNVYPIPAPHESLKSSLGIKIDFRINDAVSDPSYADV